LSYECLKAKKVENDGNSLCRAISDQVFGREDRFLEVFNRIRRYFESTSDSSESEKGLGLNFFEGKDKKIIYESISLAFERNLNIYTVDYSKMIVNWPHGPWVYLAHYTSGEYASVRFYSDNSENPGGDFYFFYETDNIKEAREKKYTEYAEYFVRDYGVGDVETVLWVLLGLYLYEVPYETVEKDYEKIFNFVEKKLNSL
jgi:hypothetical protein